MHPLGKILEFKWKNIPNSYVTYTMLYEFNGRYLMLQHNLKRPYISSEYFSWTPHTFEIKENK